MYIDNDDFSVWMQKLYAKLEELHATPVRERTLHEEKEVN